MLEEETRNLTILSENSTPENDFYFWFEWNRNG